MVEIPRQMRLETTLVLLNDNMFKHKDNITETSGGFKYVGRVLLSIRSERIDKANNTITLDGRLSLGKKLIRFYNLYKYEITQILDIQRLYLHFIHIINYG